MRNLTASHLARIGALVRFGAVAALTLSAAVARADTFDFSYQGIDGLVMGVLTTMSGVNGQYEITGISGTRGTATIAQLLAPNTATNPFTGSTNDNLLFYPANPGYVDAQGFAYTVSGSTNDYFFTYRTDGYPSYVDTVAASGGARLDEGASSVQVTHGAPAPVPGGGLLSFIALGIGGLAWRRKGIVAVICYRFGRMKALHARAKTAPYQ